MNIEVSFQIPKENLRRRIGRGQIKRAKAHGEIIEPVDKRIDGKRNRRVRDKGIILRRDMKRRPGKIRPSADGDARLGVDSGKLSDLLAEAFPGRLVLSQFPNSVRIKKSYY